MPKQTNKYWVLHANPNYWDIIGEIRRFSSGNYRVNKKAVNDVKPNDKFAIWMSGKEAGVCCFGTITEAPMLREEDPERHNLFSKDAEKNDNEDYRIRINYDWTFPDSLLQREVVLEDNLLKNIRCFTNPQGITSTDLTEEQFEQLVTIKRLDGFYNWLINDYKGGGHAKQRGGIVSSTAKVYRSDIERIGRELEKYKIVDFLFWENDAAVVEGYKKQLFKIPEIKELNEKGNNKLSSAFSNYVKFLKNNDMDIVERLRLVLKTKGIQELLNLKTYYFEKGEEAFNEVLRLNAEYKKSDFTDFQKRYKELYKQASTNKNVASSQFVYDNLSSPEEKEVFETLSKFIVFCDDKAFNKKEWNPENRLIAKANVRQNAWIFNLLNFLISGDFEDVSGNVENAIKYFQNPTLVLPMLSKKHRKLVAKHVMDKEFEEDLFVKNIHDFVGDIEYDLKNLFNNGYLISRLLYHKDIRPYWDKEEIKKTELIKTENEKTDKSMQPLNTILYGPPGTGKTYYTINKALEILGESIDGKTRAEIKDLYDKKVEDGQIVFTTFHQSMSYEDFIEGIKPQEPKEEGEPISYKVENGIFKLVAERADGRKGNFHSVLEDFKIEISEADNKEPLTIKAPGTTFDVTYRSGTMFYVSPHNSTKKDAWYAVSIDNMEKYFNTDSLDGIYNGTYVKGILNFLIENKGLEKGKNFENIKKNFVLIIDEINRGNVSQIFGELITLIEKDKRLGKPEALEVTLPYSKEKFGVPSNLYLIGTMNTADRSVEALDTALRRRFSFQEMPPNPDLVAPKSMIIRLWNDEKYRGAPWDEPTYVKDATLLYELLGINKEQVESDFYADNETETEIITWKLEDLDFLSEEMFTGVNLKTLLQVINQRVEKLLDKDHLIGHSYFMSVNSIQQLKESFQNKIIPLLQEYFFGDYGKIGLVIGKGFFKTTESNQENLFADFGDYDPGDLGERIIYKFKNISEMTDDAFSEAINLLLNK